MGCKSIKCNSFYENSLNHVYYQFESISMFHPELFHPKCISLKDNILFKYYSNSLLGTSNYSVFSLLNSYNQIVLLMEGLKKKAVNIMNLALKEGGCLT